MGPISEPEHEHELMLADIDPDTAVVEASGVQLSLRHQWRTPLHCPAIRGLEISQRRQKECNAMPGVLPIPT